MIYLVSLSVFTSVIVLMVMMLLLVESRVVKKGEQTIIINNDPEKSITAPVGKSLLSALVEQQIFLPSACGGTGSCGQCRCRVTEGGGDILPTELPHLTRAEKLDDIRLACQVKIRQDTKIEIPAEVFSIKKYSAAVVSNTNVATFIKELVLELESGHTLDFEAGAYVQIDIPEYRNLSYFQFDVKEPFGAAWEQYGLFSLAAENPEPTYRAYSLANPPSEQRRLMFTIRIATPPPGKPGTPPGIGSSYLFALKPGDRVTLSGPYGDFFVKDTGREMCFVGGGAGMAPMRCHILHQLETINTDREMTFWYGARSRQEMFYEEEFRRLEEAYPNFKFYIAFSEPLPEDRWEGMTGFIHQSLHDYYLSSHPDPDEVEYYLCGPPLMLTAVRKMFYDLGVESDRIAFDDFGG